ncbi:MAG: dihydroxy-acid dehydratase, partial [Candidatus Dojkabacteria bacterium]|nr:dihydroxy-acid dehydratase [Candidatus Dojkabacteria bacterium]
MSLNPGFQQIQQKGSKILTQSLHMLPALSLMIGAGVINSVQDKDKPFITVINSFTNHIPGHAHLRELGDIIVKKLKEKGFNVWYCNCLLYTSD